MEEPKQFIQFNHHILERLYSLVLILLSGGFSVFLAKQFIESLNFDTGPQFFLLPWVMYAALMALYTLRRVPRSVVVDISTCTVSLYFLFSKQPVQGRIRRTWHAKVGRWRFKFFNPFQGFIVMLDQGFLPFYLLSAWYVPFASKRFRRIADACLECERRRYDYLFDESNQD